MRFLENGPDLPDELLNRRADGNVVFFCGAGISVDAGQPTFWRLTLKALDRLRVAKDTKIGRALRKARRADTPLLAPPLDQVFGWLQSEYSAESVERVVAAVLREAPTERSSHHDAILRLSTDRDGNPFVVTTNFDLLFENIAPNSKRWLFPDLPDFSLTANPSGIVYLHGRLPDRHPFLSEQRSFVLGSSDFGRAYLADGWATRFLTQLLDKRTVVLLGYSAGDPPVRYLLEGLNAAAPGDERVIYAFDRGDPDEVRARWHALGVKAIAYSEFDDLWATLDAWADRVATPKTWQDSFMHLARQPPRALRSHERGQVAYFARTVNGAKALAEATESPPAEWLCVFDQFIRLAQSTRKYLSGETYEVIDPMALFGVDGDVRSNRRNPPTRANPRLDFLSSNFNDDSRVQGRLAGDAGQSAALATRLNYLAEWIANVSHEPAALWWAAGQTSLHPDLARLLRRRMGRQGGLPPTMQTLWSYALLALTHPVELDDIGFRWFRWRARVRTEGWSAAVIEEFRALVTPALQIRATSLQQFLDIVAPDSTADEGPSGITRFSVEGSGCHEKPDVPDEVLPVVFRILREGFERAGRLLAGDGIRTDLERLPAIEPDNRPGERYISEGGFASDLLWGVALFRRLAEIAPEVARAELNAWLPDDAPVLVKLRVFAWTLPGLVDNNDVFAGIQGLTDRAFWDSEMSRERLHLYRARWSGFSGDQRQLIERRIVAGPDGKGPDGDIREVSSIGADLGWLENNGCELTEPAKAVLQRIRARSDWNPVVERTADHDWDGRSGGVVVNTDPGDLPTLSLAEADRFFSTRPPREFGALREDLPFVGYVEQAPRKALAYLRRKWRQGEVNPSAWGFLMMHWPVTSSARLTAVCALRLIRLPDDVFLHLRLYVARWAAAALTPIKAGNEVVYWRLWDGIFDRIQALGEEGTRSIRDDRTDIFDDDAVVPSRKGRQFADAGAVGILAENLLERMIRTAPATVHPIDADVAQRLERCLVSVGEGADHSALWLARRLPLLYARHKAWALKVVLPLFEIDNPRAEAAWTGLFIGAHLPQPSLFKRLKPAFMKLYASREEWIVRGEFEKISVKLAVVAGKKGLTNSSYLSAEETHFVLRHVTDVGRQAALEQVRSMVTSADTWRKFGKPFFEKMWPQELRYQTMGTTNGLLRLAEQIPNKYAEIAETFMDWLMADSLPSLHDFTMRDQYNGSERPSLCEAYPTTVLQVLERLVPLPSTGVPDHLRTALDQIGATLPGLQGTSAWRKLDRFAR